MPQTRGRTHNSGFRPPEELYGVVGSPIGHSLSPVLHSWAFAALDVPAVSMKWDVAPSNFDAFMVAVRALPIHGLSVTLPHKQRILPYLDHITSEVKTIQAVNTIYWHHQELWGTNTDWQGIRRPLQERSLVPGSALVLGAGGAALAAVVALRDLGCPQMYLAARDTSKAAKTFSDPDIVLVPWQERGDCPAELLVNSTPLGMAGDLEDQSPWPEGKDLRQVTWVFDLVYNPLQTRLLQAAKQSGCGTIGGLEMFVYQGLGQCEVWTGHSFDPQQAISLLSDCLDL